MSGISRASLIWSLAMIGAGAWIHWNLVGPRMAHLRSLRVELREYANPSGGISHAGALDMLAKTQAEHDALIATVPASPGVADVVDRLKADLDALGITDCAWSIDPPTDTGDYRRTQLDLDFSASFNEVHQLLARIAAYPRLICTDAVTMQRASDTDQSVLHATIRLVVVHRAIGPGAPTEGRT